MFSQSPLRSFTEIPIGSSIEFNGPIANLPANFLFEDGSLLNVSDFPELHSVIGFSWGGDGSTTFRIPDSRGRVARCLDNGAGVDPNRTTRSALHTGGNTGDNVGTYQGDATAVNGLVVVAAGNHRHATPGAQTGSGLGGHNRAGTPEYVNAFTDYQGNHSHVLSGDSETRMKNNYKVKAIRVY